MTCPFCNIKRQSVFLSVEEQNYAQKRLLRDLKELQNHPLIGIGAIPEDKNIFVWHVNMRSNDGIYSQIYVHLIITFNQDYPKSPPKVHKCTPISHPNIFGSYIFLDMLTQYAKDHSYRGWSSAYTISSLLMQLQSFIFAEGNIDQQYGG